MLIAPFFTDTVVINKKIVCGNTILSLPNLKVTSVCLSEVSDYILEDCLLTIFDSNPDVIFDTIQYSIRDKKLYFYTNKEISTKEYENKVNIRKNNISSTQLLAEIKNVFSIEKNIDSNCISLYEVTRLMKYINKKYNEIKNADKLETILRNRFDIMMLTISDFDYNKNELLIKFYSEKLHKIKFSKDNGELYIIESTSNYGNYILSAIGEDLSICYDLFIKYKDFKTQKSCCFNSINSKFLVSISKSRVSIIFQNQQKRLKKDFELTSNSDKVGYNYRCAFSNVISAIEGNEDEIFKRIFVRIDDCPEWSRQMLYEIRKNQLEKEQRINEQIKAQELKKTKSLELVRKVFSFLNK